MQIEEEKIPSGNTIPTMEDIKAKLANMEHAIKDIIINFKEQTVELKDLVVIAQDVINADPENMQEFAKRLELLELILTKLPEFFKFIVGGIEAQEGEYAKTLASLEECQRNFLDLQQMHAGLQVNFGAIQRERDIFLTRCAQFDGSRLVQANTLLTSENHRQRQIIADQNEEIMALKWILAGTKGMVPPPMFFSSALMGANTNQQLKPFAAVAESNVNPPLFKRLCQ